MLRGLRLNQVFYYPLNRAHIARDRAAEQQFGLALAKSDALQVLRFDLHTSVMTRAEESSSHPYSKIGKWKRSTRIRAARFQPAGLLVSAPFSVLPRFANFDRPFLTINKRVLDVAYNRFVARSPQVIMECYGGGHSRPDWAEIAKASKATWLDAGSDGREIRAG